MKAYRAASVALGAVGVLQPAPAASQEATLEPDAVAAIERTASTAMSAHRIPGLSLGVVRDGRVVYAAGFGGLSPRGEPPATAGTMYRLASVTKPFTSVAVLQLAEAGKLNLAEPAHARCPSYRAPSGEPTIRQLLAHQGGLRHTTDEEDTTITGEESLAESVTRIAGEGLDFEPGTETGYTSWGYAVLGCVIEEVSGRRYMDYLEENILEPAGMTATVRDLPDFAAPGFSPGFRLRGGEAVPSEVVDTRFKVSASGLISTAADLSRFAVALYAGRLLGAEALADLFEVQATADGEPTRFTLGWIAASDRTYGDAYYFAGSMEGSTAFLYLIPGREYALAILANRERSVPRIVPMVRPIVRAVLGR